MKDLFSKPENQISLEDKDRTTIGLSRDEHYDIPGNSVTLENQDAQDEDSSFYTDPLAEEWDEELMRSRAPEDSLFLESIIEPEDEIDEVYGQYGYKNKYGEFVIEPHYAYACEFTLGLAAVNLNRTWFRSVEGFRRYENHYGYINKRGETVIPFAYDYAEPFNKYGVAVVANFNGGFLIDTSGEKIPVPEDLAFLGYHGFNERYYGIYYRSNDPTRTSVKSRPIGIYDTKERRVVLWPSISYFTVYNEERILVYKQEEDDGNSDNRKEYHYFINSKGEIL